MLLKKYFLTLVLIVCGSSLGISQESPQVYPEDEVYLAFRYQGIIDEIVVAIVRDEEFYLPVTGLFELFGINYDLRASSFSVSGFYLSKDNIYNLNFSFSTATLNGKSYEMKASDFLVKDADFYLKPEIFEDIFGLEFTINLSRLVLSLRSKNVLPIISRYENRRNQQRRMQYMQLSDEWYPLGVGRNPRILNGGFLDYTFFSNISGNSGYARLNSSIGTELFYGDLSGSVNTIVNDNGSSVETSGFRWRYVDDKSPWFTRLNIGNISATGLTSQSFQGFSVSNLPITTLSSFDQYIIGGNTDSDAEIELYQDNRLVDVAKTDDLGYYRFFVPLSYGRSNFKIRIYTKQGEIIEYDRQIEVPFSFLPPGEVRYQLAAGSAPLNDGITSTSEPYSQADLAYGVNSWLSVRTGIDYYGGGSDDKPVYYNKISSRVGSLFLLNLDLVYGSYYRLVTNGFGSANSSWNIDYTNFQSAGTLNPLEQEHALQGGFHFPIMIRGVQTFFRTDASWQEYVDHRNYTYRLNLNNSLRGFRLRYGLQEEHYVDASNHSETSQGYLGVVYSFPRLSTVHYLLRGSYFRADYYYNMVQGNISLVNLQLTKQFSKKLRGQLLVSNDFEGNYATFEVGLTWDAERVRSASSVAQKSNVTSYTQSLRGSVALDRENHEYVWDNRQQVGRAGGSIRMFIDENGSGTFEGFEEIIPGSAVSLERATARQITQSGITRITLLQPYRRYNFKVDVAKIVDPLLVPRNKQFSVVFDPNSYKTIDVPFYTTGIIDGRVDKNVDSTFTPLSGLRIHLKSLDESYSATLRTFSDGSYYSMEVPPGDYELWVDESQLQFLGMTSNPAKLEFTVTSVSGGDFIEGLDFILE